MPRVAWPHENKTKTVTDRSSIIFVVSSCGRILWWGPTDWVLLIPATGESRSALTGMHASATLLISHRSSPFPILSDIRIAHPLRSGASWVCSSSLSAPWRRSSVRCGWAPARCVGVAPAASPAGWVLVPAGSERAMPAAVLGCACVTGSIGGSTSGGGPASGWGL